MGERHQLAIHISSALHPLPDRLSRHDDQREDERRPLQALSTGRPPRRDQEPLRPWSLAQREGLPRLALPRAVSARQGGLAEEVCHGGRRRVLSPRQRIRLV